MEAELSKIRPHTSSNLPHQKAPATLLSALESTFKEQNTDPSPAAYFAGLLTALEGSVQKERGGGELKLGDGDLLPAELYLLALVAPFVPPPIIRHHLNSLLRFGEMSSTRSWTNISKPRIEQVISGIGKRIWH